MYTPGPWASVGVQLKAPPAVIDAPVGTSPARPSARLKVRVLAGTSASVAVAVKVSGDEFVDRLVADGGEHRGHVDLVDRDVIVSKSVGVPLSVTTT